MNANRKSIFKIVLLAVFAAMAINQTAFAENIDYTVTPNRYLSVGHATPR